MKIIKEGELLTDVSTVFEVYWNGCESGFAKKALVACWKAIQKGDAAEDIIDLYTVWNHNTVFHDEVEKAASIVARRSKEFGETMGEIAARLIAAKDAAYKAAMAARPKVEFDATYW